MKTAVQFTRDEEKKALPILLRHSPGMVRPDRTYVLSDDAVQKLREEGIQFREVSREGEAPVIEGAAGGKRI